LLRLLIFGLVTLFDQLSVGCEYSGEGRPVTPSLCPAEQYFSARENCDLVGDEVLGINAGLRCQPAGWRIFEDENVIRIEGCLIDSAVAGHVESFPLDVLRLAVRYFERCDEMPVRTDFFDRYASNAVVSFRSFDVHEADVKVSLVIASSLANRNAID